VEKKRKAEEKRQRRDARKAEAALPPRDSSLPTEETSALIDPGDDES
jgi:hypothetical protein